MKRARRWRKMVGLLVTMGLCAAGCGDDDDAAEATRESEHAVNEHSRAAEPVDEWADDEPSEAEVAVEADFADEAERSINGTNYQAELDRLEAEIGAD